MSDSSDKHHSSECPETEKCMEILYLLLDNEASDEEAAFLNHHIEKCMQCFERFEVEKEIRLLLKTKLRSQQVPADLAETIRSQVFESA